MEVAAINTVSRRPHKRKRKVNEISTSEFPLDDLNQDVLERVLAWLPTASFFRLKSVCKRWKFVADSATFRLACSQVPRRDPWFLMVDFRPEFNHQFIVFDSLEKNWKTLNLPRIDQDQKLEADFIPVAASGGLICFDGLGGDFVIVNPVTASSRRINSPFPKTESSIQAISMVSKSETFELVLISGELPNLKFRRYKSTTGEWERKINLTRNAGFGHAGTESSDDCTQYFLTKSGNVVSTDIQRSPAKQYSAILTVQNGDEVLCFVSSSGTIVSCNLTRRFFSEYPRLLPVFSEYSIDLVECEGQMYVVLLSEFLESSSLRVWCWDNGVNFWKQVAAMPPWMAHKFHGKKPDINCGGGGGQMMVCVNSGEACSYVMCDLRTNEWIELEGCCPEGKAREFVCGFSFEPRIEAFA